MQFSVVYHGLARSTLRVNVTRTNSYWSKSGCIGLIRSSVRGYTSKGGSPIDIYNKLAKEGTIKDDSFQRTIVDKLDALHKACAAYSNPHQDLKTVATATQHSSFFSRLLGKQKEPIETVKSPVTAGQTIPKGLYLYGDVGTGKTFLMDLFYNSCDFTKNKRRIHFHNFMLDVHQRIFLLREKSGHNVMDPIIPVADSLATEAWLLCFDEFQVTDIADAMILYRLFERLFEKGVVLVTTSNRHPEDLYKGGLQRESFMPFIKLLQQTVITTSLNSGVDYRLTGTQTSTVYFTPLTEENRAEVDTIFKKIVQDNEVAPKTIIHQKRNIYIPEATKTGVARFKFVDLCDRPMGAGDYIIIAKNFHTVFITDIPKMSLGQKTQAKRFIILIDTLYENKVKVIFSAEAKPNQLFSHDPTLVQGEHNELLDVLGGNAAMFSGQEEIFQFARCVSRLTEMQSDEYLQANREHVIE